MKSNFRLPGPTPVPPKVYQAMQREMIPHRSAEFSNFYLNLLERLRKVCRTASDTFLWPASGSAGWEIAIVNLLSPGDEVVALVTGDFGDRFANVGEKLGLRVRRVQFPWGVAATPEALQAALDQHPDARAVFLTHNETSTGVTNPIQELASITRERGVLSLVDAVSSAAGLPLETDEWGLNFVLSGSQKAWMCPPGLAIISVGDRAWQSHKRSTFPRFFWDLESMRQSAEKGHTPTTPPLSLYYALDAAIQMVEAETLSAVWDRHARLGQKTRDSVAALGLELLAAPGFESNTVTAIHVPNGLRAKEIVVRMKEEHGITIAGGQGKLRDSIIRIGHMGWVDADDISSCLTALKSVLS